MCCQLTDWPPKVDGAPEPITEGNLSREEDYHVVDALHLLQGEVELTGTRLLDIGVHLCMCVCISLTNCTPHGERKGLVHATQSVTETTHDGCSVTRHLVYMT